MRQFPTKFAIKGTLLFANGTISKQKIFHRQELAFLAQKMLNKSSSFRLIYIIACY